MKVKVKLKVKVNVKVEVKIKVRHVRLEACSGPDGSRKLQFLDFITKAKDGGKVASITHQPLLPQGNTPVTHFC